MHSITAGLLLAKLNTGSRFFTLYELRDRDDDSAEFDARRELNALLKEGFISIVGDRRYKIIVDIYTLRKNILKGAAEDADDCELVKSEAYRFDCGDIVDSVWQTKSDIAKPESGRAEQEEDVEEEINRRRREYLEKRRLELIARMREEMAESEEDGDDEDDDGLFSDDEEDNEEEEDDEFSMTAHALFVKSEEEEMHEKIRNLLIDGDRNSKLAVAALKLCASEGYVSPWLLCKTFGVDEDTANFVCFWLYINDFIKRDLNDANKYLLDMSEKVFFACCREAEERKNSLGNLAGTLKKISERKQEKEQEERTSFQKYANSYQFKKVVRAKLIALVRTDLKMTRAKVIIKAEGCLHAARDIGNDNAAAVYEKVVAEIRNMSEYMYNRLKSQFDD